MEIEMNYWIGEVEGFFSTWPVEEEEAQLRNLLIKSESKS